MPSTQPSPDNDYQWPPLPSPAELNRAIWNTVMMTVSNRLKTLEDQRVTLEDVINDLKLFGLERLDQAIGGLLTTVEERTSALEEMLALVEANFEAIVANGVAAAKVVESATRVFLTPGQKAEIGALRDDLTALDASVESRFATLHEDARRMALM